MGIGESTEALLGANCGNIPANQKGSFMGRVAGFPLLIRIDNTFTSDQKQQLLTAVAGWNLASQQAIRQDIFQVQFADLPSSDRTLDPTDCSQGFGNETSFAIVRETSGTHWSAIGFSRSVPGATFRCEQNNHVTRQIIFLYPETVDPSQLSSVLIHELGHSIGLDHSCLASGTRSNFVSCTGIMANDPYHQAVMYPWLHVKSGPSDSPEIKDSLRTNDRVRGACAMGVNS